MRDKRDFDDPSPVEESKERHLDRHLLEGQGFDGFVAVGALRKNPERHPPAHAGVYALLWEGAGVPAFLKVSPAGHTKGRDPSVSVARLQQNWVPGAEVLYFGKTDGASSTGANLKARLSAYLNHGAGRRAPHWGGRFVWQMRQSDRIIVCWRLTTSGTARDCEKDLLTRFKRDFGRLPFANLRI